MAITEKQRERRQKSIGGSDIATLLGHNPRSQYDLWLEKKHGVVTFEGNDATEFGQVVEGSIADWAAQKLGVKIRKNVFRASSNDPFHANLDAVVIGDMAAVASVRALRARLQALAALGEHLVRRADRRRGMRLRGYGGRLRALGTRGRRGYGLRRLGTDPTRARFIDRATHVLDQRAELLGIARIAVRVHGLLLHIRSRGPDRGPSSRSVCSRSNEHGGLFAPDGDLASPCRWDRRINGTSCVKVRSFFGLARTVRAEPPKSSQKRV